MERCTKVVLTVIAVLAVLVMAIVLIVLSMTKLNSDEIGLQYDRIQKTLHDEAREEGLHFGPVGFGFIVFPSVYKTINFDKLFCLNKDGVVIELIVSFQYRARKSALYRIVTEFKDHEGYLEVLKVVAESAIHEACSRFRTYQFPLERGNFTDEIRTRILVRYKSLECEVTDVQVNNFERPTAYEDAVTDKERAREDIQVALNERPQKLTEATTSKRRAEFQANVTIATAESEATIMQNQARAEAIAIRVQYEQEAETYAEIIASSGLNFTTEGFLSYLGIRVISDAHNPVYVGIQSPAKSTYVKP